MSVMRDFDNVENGVLIYVTVHETRNTEGVVVFLVSSPGVFQASVAAFMAAD